MMDASTIHNPHLEGGSFFWPGGPVGVLLCHGYSATTAEVRPLARALHERGCTVSGPLLPGHGTRPDDLNRLHWRAWLEAMESAYQELAAHCRHIFIGGESMGATLALYLASSTPAVSGVLNYAPALRLPNHVSIKARLAAPFIPSVPKQGLHSVRRWQGYKVNPLRALVQLLNLQRATLRRLAHVRQPLLIVQGRLDTVIDPRSVDLLYLGSSSSHKEVHWLEQSPHTLILEPELPHVVALTGRFMEWVLLEAGQPETLTEV